MKRRIAGLALDGHFDLAARDWDAEGEWLEDVALVAGGTEAAVVTTLDGRTIAGPQAELAPHGRGEGWGAIGRPEHRRPLARALQRPEEGSAGSDVLGAIAALAPAADEVILAVADLPEFSEARRSALLRAVNSPARPVRLLWRPVAAMLDLICRGIIGPGQVGQRFRFLIHGAHGLEDQTLALARDAAHPDHVAPRRDGPGRACVPEVKLERLFATALHKVKSMNPDIDWSNVDRSRVGPKILTGEAEVGHAEILRSRDGNWLAAWAPSLDPVPLDGWRFDLPATEDGIAATFLITPMVAPFAMALEDAVARAVGTVHVVDRAAVARGSLYAGRLIERGLPHYFDRLERIAIAVLREDDPVFADLIPHDAVVPANREHVSVELGGFVWGKDKTDIEFYVLKGAGEVRHWTVARPAGPARDVAVSLRIRQTPGQSWARLTVGSGTWEDLARSPVALDWEALEPLALAPEEVLEKLRTPPPTIPERIVEEPHIALWQGSAWAGNRMAMRYLREELAGHCVNASMWRVAVSSPARNPANANQRYWCVGTDGALPVEMSPTERAGFLRLLDRFSDELLAATLQQPPASNDLLITLTWCFTRCPERVQDRILEALDADLRQHPDPLLAPIRARTVLRQGAGRAVTGETRLRHLFEIYARSPVNNDITNGLAMALSRRQEAPNALSRFLVDYFLKELGSSLIKQIERRNFQIRFKNTLSAIAGIFRWRHREPLALLAKRDPVARHLRDELVRARGLLVGPSYATVTQRDEKVALIDSIIAYLDGGGDPDILRKIETAE